MLRRAGSPTSAPASARSPWPSCGAAESRSPTSSRSTPASRPSPRTTPHATDWRSAARILSLDVCDAHARRAAGLNDSQAEAVVTNPPFFDAGAVRISPNGARARAHVFTGVAGDAPLAAWIRACVAILKAGGRFVMIHRPDALPAILAAAENRLGALALLPVHPRAGASAHRLLLSGIKGSKAPLRITDGLVLHEADGRFTREADAIHRGEALIEWGG